MFGMVALAVVGVIVLFGAVWTVTIYNRLVTLGKKRDEGWSGILVQLKRRHDLVPNLVAVVKAYAAHERGVLEEVTKMRAIGAAEGPRELGQSEQAFSQSLIRLMAIVEKYPELKADRNFMELQNSLVRIEDDIQMSRRYYNGTVRDYNMMASTFPNMLIARGFGFGESLFFDLDAPAEKDMPTVSFLNHD